MCVECGTPLVVSNSPVAKQERAFIREQIAAGKSKAQIKAALVEEYGEQVLAEPGGSGLQRDAVDRPGAARRCSAPARHRARRPPLAPQRRLSPTPPLAPALSPEDARRLDAELRQMSGGVDTTVIAAFAVGFVSFISPCVLPLVPGYLSAVSGVSLAEMKTGERSLLKILLPAIVFCLSFTVVFVALGMTATGLGSTLQDSRDDARQGRRRGDHRARRVLPADAVRAQAQPRVAPGRADHARRLGRPAGRRRRVRGRLDALRRPDARLDPVGRRDAGHRRQGRRSCSRSTRSGSPSRSCSPRSRSRA